MNERYYKIINNNNNCYLNSILQIFLNNRETVNYLKKYIIFYNSQGSSPLGEQIINPRNFLNLIKSKSFDVTRQNDAHEALLRLVDKIPEIDKKITGELLTTFECLQCFKTRKIIENFNTINLYSDNIEDSIKYLFRIESHILECERCRMSTNTVKKSSITKIGDIIIFHNILKLKLDKDKIKENIIYDNKKYYLSGIIKHYGNTSGGHYNYINFVNKILIDDDNLTRIQEVPFNNIYLLIYNKFLN